AQASPVRRSAKHRGVAGITRARGAALCALRRVRRLRVAASRAASANRREAARAGGELCADRQGRAAALAAAVDGGAVGLSPPRAAVGEARVEEGQGAGRFSRTGSALRGGPVAVRSARSGSGGEAGCARRAVEFA